MLGCGENPGNIRVAVRMMGLLKGVEFVFFCDRIEQDGVWSKYGRWRWKFAWLGENWGKNRDFDEKPLKSRGFNGFWADFFLCWQGARGWKYWFYRGFIEVCVEKFWWFLIQNMGYMSIWSGEFWGSVGGIDKENFYIIDKV